MWWVLVCLGRGVGNSHFVEVCSKVPNKQYASVCTDNGLAPNRRQVIIWTIDGLAYWRIYAPVGLKDLMHKYDAHGPFITATVIPQPQLPISTNDFVLRDPAKYPSNTMA